MLKKISEYFLYKKIQKLNKKEFNQENNINTRGILLLEFNSFHILHIIFSYLSNYFVKKHNLKIVAYYSHVLLSYKLERTLIQKIKSFIAGKLGIGFFGIYKSFGVKEFLFPRVNDRISILSNTYYLKIYKKIRSNEDILHIAIDKIKLEEGYYFFS